MLLKLQNVKKYFPLSRDWRGCILKFVPAVDGVSLSLAESENLGLVGESGSGKTTLGRLILKLYPLTSGKIFLEDEDISNPGKSRLPAIRRRIQMVFQDPYNSLDPRYTVRGSLKEALALQDLTSERLPDKGLPNNKPGIRRMAQEAQMEAMLAAVGIAKNALDRFPHEFSGGERQRIAIARALIMRPKLLILDEATSALDVLVQEQILQLLERLQKEFGLTYLLISHDLRVVMKLCRRIAVMYKGKIVETGPAKEIFTNPLHLYTKELLSAAVNYKSSQKDFDIAIPADSYLIDKGNNHFVVNY